MVSARAADFMAAQFNSPAVDFVPVEFISPVAVFKVAEFVSAGEDFMEEEEEECISAEVDFMAEGAAVVFTVKSSPLRTLDTIFSWTAQERSNNS